MCERAGLPPSRWRASAKSQSEPDRGLTSAPPSSTRSAPLVQLVADRLPTSESRGRGHPWAVAMRARRARRRFVVDTCWWGYIRAASRSGQGACRGCRLAQLRCEPARLRQPDAPTRPPPIRWPAGHRAHRIRSRIRSTQIARGAEWARRSESRAARRAIAADCWAGASDVRALAGCPVDAACRSCR